MDFPAAYLPRVDAWHYYGSMGGGKRNSRAASIFWAAGALCLCLLAGTAYAQPLTANDFDIDAVTSPVLGSYRTVGMGGAFTALATDISGAAWNPASFGSRTIYELDWFEYDFGLSVFSPGLAGMDDFFNNHSGLAVGSFQFLTIGLRLQFGNFGLGTETRFQIFDTSAGADLVKILLIESHTGFAYAFWDGQFVLGIGGRVADLDMELADNTKLVHFTGTGFEAGAVLKIDGQPWRLGLTGRAPVESRAEEGAGMEVIDGVARVRGFVLPQKVYLPWEVQLGVAWQFGPRPLNRAWREAHDPEPGLQGGLDRARCRRAARQLTREMRDQGQEPPNHLCPDLPADPQDPQWWIQEEALRELEEQAFEKTLAAAKEAEEARRRAAYQAMARPYYLVSADLLIVGSASQAIGIDAFVEQQRRPSGQEPTVGFRLGAETELIANRLKLRSGFYLEPARQAQASYRPHGTAGIELRLFSWDVFGYFDPFELKMGLSVDLAPRYFDLGLGIGFWH